MSDLAMNQGIVPAIPTPHGVGARWWASVVRFFTVTEVSAAAPSVDLDDRRTPKHYPSRSSYMEDAAMRRAMYRL